MQYPVCGWWDHSEHFILHRLADHCQSNPWPTRLLACCSYNEDCSFIMYPPLSIAAQLYSWVNWSTVGWKKLLKIQNGSSWTQSLNHSPFYSQSSTLPTKLPYYNVIALKPWIVFTVNMHILLIVTKSLLITCILTGIYTWKRCKISVNFAFEMEPNSEYLC